MHEITGLLGRDELVDQVVREIRKGKHVLLTGPMGIGKSAVLRAAIERAERRRREADPPGKEHREAGRRMTLIRLADHQAKGQFVDMARQLLEAGVLKPRALDLPERLEEADPVALWPRAKRNVNRLSMRELAAALIPALAGSHRRVVIAVDDMT
jgi:energy-coupling factor transporter ATP-binding protein EcfA2